MTVQPLLSDMGLSCTKRSSFAFKMSTTPISPPPSAYLDLPSISIPGTPPRLRQDLPAISCPCIDAIIARIHLYHKSENSLQEKQEDDGTSDIVRTFGAQEQHQHPEVQQLERSYRELKERRIVLKKAIDILYRQALSIESDIEGTMKLLETARSKGQMDAMQRALSGQILRQNRLIGDIVSTCIVRHLSTNR